LTEAEHAFNPMIEVKLLLLIGIANGAPVIARYLAGRRYARPLDFDIKLADGRALFGKSKTIFGALSSLLFTAVLGYFLGFSLGFGLGLASCAMLGDLLSSFIKRRLGMPPSSQALGLDQIPESLLPMVIGKYGFDLSWLSVAGVVIAFFILELLLSRILYKLRIKNAPY